MAASGLVPDRDVGDPLDILPSGFRFLLLHFPSHHHHLCIPESPSGIPGVESHE